MRNNKWVFLTLIALAIVLHPQADGHAMEEADNSKEEVGSLPKKRKTNTDNNNSKEDESSSRIVGLQSIPEELIQYIVSFLSIPTENDHTKAQRMLRQASKQFKENVESYWDTLTRKSISEIPYDQLAAHFTKLPTQKIVTNLHPIISERWLGSLNIEGDESLLKELVTSGPQHFNPKELKLKLAPSSEADPSEILENLGRLLERSPSLESLVVDISVSEMGRPENELEDKILVVISQKSAIGLKSLALYREQEDMAEDDGIMNTGLISLASRLTSLKWLSLRNISTLESKDTNRGVENMASQLTNLESLTLDFWCDFKKEKAISIAKYLVNLKYLHLYNYDNSDYVDPLEYEALEAFVNMPSIKELDFEEIKIPLKSLKEVKDKYPKLSIKINKKGPYSYKTNIKID